MWEAVFADVGTTLMDEKLIAVIRVLKYDHITSLRLGEYIAKPAAAKLIALLKGGAHRLSRNVRIYDNKFIEEHGNHNDGYDYPEISEYLFFNTFFHTNLNLQCCCPQAAYIIAKTRLAAPVTSATGYKLPVALAADVAMQVLTLHSII